MKKPNCVWFVNLQLPSLTLILEISEGAKFWSVSKVIKHIPKNKPFLGIDVDAVQIRVWTASTDSGWIPL